MQYEFGWPVTGEKAPFYRIVVSNSESPRWQILILSHV